MAVTWRLHRIPCSARTLASPSSTRLHGGYIASLLLRQDVGIAEQHAVTFAAGQAAEGLVPFCAIYSTFLQRAYDQVRVRVRVGVEG